MKKVLTKIQKIWDDTKKVNQQFQMKLRNARKKVAWIKPTYFTGSLIWDRERLSRKRKLHHCYMRLSTTDAEDYKVDTCISVQLHKQTAWTSIQYINRLEHRRGNPRRKCSCVISPPMHRIDLHGSFWGVTELDCSTLSRMQQTCRKIKNTE